MTFLDEAAMATAAEAQDRITALEENPPQPGPHGHAAVEIGGLHAVAITGAYSALAGRPSIPEARRMIVNTGTLSANTVKNISVTWPSSMPNIGYAVTATVETATPHTVTVGVVPGSKTVNGCTLAVRSTAAVGGGGLNVNVIALA